MLLTSIPCAAGSKELTLTSESALWLAGDSTLHPFTSRTSQLKLNAVLDAQEASAAPAKDVVQEILQQDGLKTFNLSIPVEALKSGHSGLDKNMYKALNSRECPSIDFQMLHYEVGTSTAASLPVRASGTLRVACRQKTVTLEAALTPEPGALRVQGTYPLLMTDYGVTPPRLMLGAIKVKDEVVVHYDLRMTP